MIISSEALSERYLHVNNCGRQTISIEDTVTIRERGRVDYHILYVLSGICYAVIDGKQVTARSGGIILFRPHERQEYRFFKVDKSEFIWIHFTGVGCETYLRELGLYDKTVLEVGKSAELSAALEGMLLSRGLEGGENRDICDGYLYLVLSLFARGAKYGKEKLKRFFEVSAVIEYINANYKTVLPVEDYAKMCHLSKSRFEHVFKEHTGNTPIGYLYRTRIDVAMRLLETTDLRISAIAEETGFNDANYFTRVFKKYTGTTPGKFRERESD